MSRFYFAWVDESATTFSSATHAVEDEKIVSFVIEHAEGEFASLSIDVKNPRVALLAPSRKVWAWLSWDDGSGTISPLFFGRLVGVPSNINREVVTLQFIARPNDFTTQKDALADTMRVAPYWDPVFLAPEQRSDPDSVLEARSEVWCIDRTTHNVTTSDLLVGEDGTETFAASEVPYDSVDITLKETPLRRVQVVGRVKWTQSDANNSGIVVFNSKEFGPLPTLSLLSIWPRTGASLGGGWVVTRGLARSDQDGITVKSSTTTGQGGTISSSGPQPEPANASKVLTAAQLHSGSDQASAQTSGIWVVQPTVWGTLSIGYEAARSRTEQVVVEVSADVQALVTQPGEDEVEVLPVNGTDVGLPLDDGYGVPIVDVSRRSYFPTDRGLQSLEYLILIGRAALVLRSRAVEISFRCSFARAANLSLRKNAILHDDRLPTDATAVGKIIRYRIVCDGNSGDLHGEVTMACSVGTGGAIAAEAGTPTYVADGYVDVGYQFYVNQTVLIGTSDIAYTVPVDEPNDDGIVFPITKIPFITQPTVTHVRIGPGGQDEPLGPLTPPLDGVLGPDIEKIVTDYMNTVETRLTFSLPSLTGSKFASQYNIATTQLKIPAGINLGAV